jgi:GNAT superfamily N-acetyltransferase
MIRKMIKASEETYGGCVGLFVDDTLVSWLCRYLDGTLGMLWTEDAHRKKGYAELVLMAAVYDISKRSKESNGGCTSRPIMNAADEPMVSYIVDSNQASQNLYKKLGWMRVVDADWAGFASRKIFSS